MSNAVIGALRVNLGLDSANFERGAKRSQNTLKTMRNQFAVIAGAAAAMGAAITTAALRGARDIDEAAKASRRLEASIGGFRAAQLAAREMGVSISALTDNLQTMNREIERGSKGATEALQKLGLAASDLAGLDADQKLALIADSVQELGLNADQASVLMQDLGIRNREMVLAVMSGGDAFRDARADIEDYGLALNSVDAANIEQANDAIGRLGIISQYVGQQLALALVPAMGRLAQAMTDSMREGELLRTVIDGLVANLGQITATVGVAVTFFGVRYVGALVAAKLATFTLTGALVALRTALLRTGIGALIIGAGYLVNEFAKLSTAVGGFGNAMKLLGDVAKAVWDGIVDGARAIPVALNAIWERMKSGFLGALSDMAVSWSGFLRSIAESGTSIPLLGGAFDKVGEAASRAAASARDFGIGAAAAGNAAASLRREASSLATGGLDRVRTAMDRLNKTVSENEDNTTDASEAIKQMNAALGDLEGAAGGGGGSGGGGAAGAVEELNQELQETPQIVDDVANAWADFVVDGFRDFQGFVQSVLGSFRNMLRDMIATAARNRIMISMGMGGGIAGGVAQAGGLLGGGGGAGGLLGSIGGIGSALAGGFTNAIGATFSGGLSMGMASIGGQVATAVAAPTATAIAGAIGAIAAPLAILGVVFMAFRKKVTNLASGIRIAVDGIDTTVQTFSTDRTSRFFGLSRKTRTTFSDADADIADPVIAMVDSIRNAVDSMALGIGISQENLDKVVHDFAVRVSTKGLSEGEAQAAIQKEFARINDILAQAALAAGGLAHGFEGASDRLQSLSASLASVNGMFQFLERTLFDISVRGALAAENLVQLFGGLDNFSQAHEAYFQNFYSEQERVTLQLADMTRALDGLGLQLPDTIAGFRALVEAQDLTAESGRRAYAALVQMSGQFAEVQGVIQQTMQAAAQAASSDVSGAESALRQAVSAEQSAIQQRIRGLEAERSAISRSSRDFVSPARQFFESMSRTARDALKGNTEINEASRRSALMGLRTMLQTGRVDAGRAQELAGVASEITDAQFKTAEDMRREQVVTANVIKEVAETELENARARQSRANMNAQRQIAALTEQIDLAQEELEKLDNVLNRFNLLNNSVLSVADAIRRLQSAIVAELATTRAATKSEDLISNMESNDVPAFARGGYHSGGLRLVGENGPELEMTGPSRILSTQQTRAMISDEELKNEVREMKEYIRELVKINNKQERSLKEIEMQGEMQ